MSETSRRGFFGALSSLFKDERLPVRPPYAGEGETFNACKTCEGMCVSGCEEKIIHRDADGLVFLDFQSTGCSDCQKCLELCMPDVLHDPMRFIQGRARINALSCMSHHNTICFSCKEPCLENAIHFEGMFRPIVIKDKCTACGYCVAVCPSGAIEVIR